MTLTDVDNAVELRRRIANLKTRIAGERTELQSSMQDWRSNFTPATIVRQVAKSLLPTDRPADALTNGLTGLAWQLPLRLLTNVLVRDPRAAFLIKNLAPLAIRYGPVIWEKASQSLPTRVKIYGMLRKRIIKLRARFREVEEDASWFI